MSKADLSPKSPFFCRGRKDLGKGSGPHEFEEQPVEGGEPVFRCQYCPLALPADETRAAIREKRLAEYIRGVLEVKS